ncbi:hypothetical protein BKA93DRAFT_753169 [Sparassis latifolia]
MTDGDGAALGRPRDPSLACRHLCVRAQFHTQAKPEIGFSYPCAYLPPTIDLDDSDPCQRGLCPPGNLILTAFRCEYGGTAFGPTNKKRRLDLERRIRCHFSGWHHACVIPLIIPLSFRPANKRREIQCPFRSISQPLPSWNVLSGSRPFRRIDLLVEESPRYMIIQNRYKEVYDRIVFYSRALGPGHPSLCDR